jgi:hypothetical protein
MLGILALTKHTEDGNGTAKATETAQRENRSNMEKIKY